MARTLAPLELRLGISGSIAAKVFLMFCFAMVVAIAIEWRASKASMMSIGSAAGERQCGRRFGAWGSVVQGGGWHPGDGNIVVDGRVAARPHQLRRVDLHGSQLAVPADAVPQCLQPLRLHDRVAAGAAAAEEAAVLPYDHCIITGAEQQPTEHGPVNGPRPEAITHHD